MAKLGEWPLYCQCASSAAKFRSGSRSLGMSLANNSLLYPSIRFAVERGKLRAHGISNFLKRQLCFHWAGYTRYSAFETSRNVGARRCTSVEELLVPAFKLFSQQRWQVHSFSQPGHQSQDGRFTEEAEEAFLTLLLENELSTEDARAVVTKAPVFIRELAACIHDLEESGILPAGEDEQSSNHLDRKATIYKLASRSRGMSPLLESLGVPLPSVSKVSHSLSSQRLPDVLSKVRYVEELLIEADHSGRPVDGLMRFMMKNLSASIWEDEDMQRTVAFFEKIEAQEGGLAALKQSTYALSRLLQAFPQIFNRSLDGNLKPVIHFMEDLGIGKNMIGRLILCCPPIFLQDVKKDLVPRKRILKQVGIRVQDMGRMWIKYPWLFSKCVGNNVHSIVEFLESIKVPKSKIDKSITTCPHLLGCSSTGALTSMVLHINEFGFKSRRLGRALSQSPQLLIHSIEEFDAVVAFLKSVGIEADDISKLLRRSPEILGIRIDSTLQNKIEFLKEIGLHHDQLGRVIRFYPEVLSASVESALRPRINYLHDCGFSKREISLMILRFPPMLGYNGDTVICPKLEFLVKTMGKSKHDAVGYPKYFSYSLEKKIKPRARVLANRNIECNLQAMLGKNDDQFAAEFLGIGSLLIPP